MLPACLLCCSHKPAQKVEAQPLLPLCQFKALLKQLSDSTRLVSVKPSLHPALLHTLLIIPLLNTFHIRQCCTPGYAYWHLPFPSDSLGDVIVHSCGVSVVALTNPHVTAS